MPSSATVQWNFPTKLWAQCRNEAPFPVTIWFGPVPDGAGIRARIDCPHCGRGYYAQQNGEWTSDRPLKFLNYPNEVEEARKHCI